MAEGETAHGIGGLLGKTTAGLPNWAWLLVIAGGIVAAIFVPKLFGSGNSSDTTDGSTTSPSDVLPPTFPGGGTIGDSGGYGGPIPPIPVGTPPPAPMCSLEHSCAAPPPDGKHCPPGMHLAKDGLCRCNAKHMVNWGHVCLPPGVLPPGSETGSTTTPPPANTPSAVAGHTAASETSTDKLNQQVHIMPPVEVKPPYYHPPVKKRHFPVETKPIIRVEPYREEE